jgi:hypothetical protein
MHFRFAAVASVCENWVNIGKLSTVSECRTVVVGFDGLLKTNAGEGVMGKGFC